MEPFITPGQELQALHRSGPTEMTRDDARSPKITRDAGAQPVPPHRPVAVRQLHDVLLRADRRGAAAGPPRARGGGAARRLAAASKGRAEDASPNRTRGRRRRHSSKAPPPRPRAKRRRMRGRSPSSRAARCPPCLGRPATPLARRCRCRGSPRPHISLLASLASLSLRRCRRRSSASCLACWMLRRMVRRSRSRSRAEAAPRGLRTTRTTTTTTTTTRRRTTSEPTRQGLEAGTLRPAAQESPAAGGGRVDRGIGEEEGIGERNSRAADAWLSLACVAAIAFQGGASCKCAAGVEQRDGSGGAPRGTWGEVGEGAGSAPWSVKGFVALRSTRRSAGLERKKSKRVERAESGFCAKNTMLSRL